MSREIKFRAWNSIDKVMCDNSTTLTNLRGFIKSKHYHPMQFTGQKDINGTEMYEGDIVFFEDGEDFEDDFIISMSDNGCFIAHNQKDKSDFYYLDDQDYKVIGNVHQNPELLK